MFYEHNDDDFHEILPGIRVKTLVYGEKTLMAEFRMQPGAHFTRHSHPHEQSGYLVSGAMRLVQGDRVFEVQPGDSWCIPPNVEHFAESLEESVMVQQFSPLREDYLAYYQKRTGNPMDEQSKIDPRYVGLDNAAHEGKLSREEIKKRFDHETALVYRRQPDPAWLPDFWQMTRLIPELLRSRLPKDALILDIGAGTGNLSRVIMEALPDVKMVLMDFSEDMLSEVPNVLTDFPGRYVTDIHDFLDADFGISKYAGAVSSLAIHHCRGEAEYSRIYDRLYKALQPGGIFICCDVVAGADDLLTQLNEDGWRSNLKEQQFSDTDIERVLSNYHVEDSPLVVCQSSILG